MNEIDNIAQKVVAKSNIVVPKIIAWSLIILTLLIVSYITYNYEANRKDPHALQVIERHYNDSLKKSYDEIIKTAKRDSSDRVKEISILKDSINSLQQQINQNDADIQDAQTQYVFKIKHINTLSTDSLAKFFTNRFGRNKQ